jgi:hypothetical protein
MNRYWDANEIDRAKFTRDEVKAMLTVELMEKGVATVESPTLIDVSEIELDSETFYGVEYDGAWAKTALDLVFATKEDAHAFTELAVSKSEYEYSIGEKYRFGKPLTGLAVTTVGLCRHSDVLTMTARLKQQHADKEENNKRMSNYNAAAKAVDDATSGVWDDWHNCVATDARMRKIAATFSEYTETCNGDITAATTFLFKLYDRDDVEKAAEWCDVEIPLPETVVEAAE